VDVKRSAIWLNPMRNRRMARLTLAVARGDSQGIAELCPEAAGLPVAHRGGSVVVLVENEEHRESMTQQLMQYESEADGMAEFPGRKSIYVVTYMKAAEVDWTEIDVLLRADGGTGLPPIPHPRSLAIPYDSSRRLLLIDAKDRGSLRDRLRARAAAYRDCGWLPPGIGSPEEDVDQYVAASRRTRR
jgi:hypothetical protein